MEKIQDNLNLSVDAEFISEEKTDSIFLVGLLSSIPVIIFPLGSIFGGKLADTCLLYTSPSPRDS